MIGQADFRYQVDYLTGVGNLRRNQAQIDFGFSTAGDAIELMDAEMMPSRLNFLQNILLLIIQLWQF